MGLETSMFIERHCKLEQRVILYLFLLPFRPQEALIYVPFVLMQ